MKPILLIALVFVIGMASGCNRAYTGIYFVDRAENASSVNFEGLDSNLAETLRPLGFEMRPMPPGTHDYFVLVNDKKRAESMYANMPGADTRISVAVGYRDLTITIRDQEHDKETVFVKAVKGQIEKMFKDRYGVSELKFRRQADMFL